MDIDSLKRRAAAGNCAAQTTLGISYLYGDGGLDIDYGEALRFLSMAAEAGASRAVVNLAHMYAEGLGVPQDIAKAIELYDLVGRVEFLAAIALGRIYSKGLGVGIDHELARYWYSIAASFEGRVNCYEELAEAKRYMD